MRAMGKELVKRYVLGALARPALQGALGQAHRMVLAGMNIGTGGHVSSSGERTVLERLAAVCPPGAAPVVFDVGANVGDFARHASSAWGARARLYCFEPSRGAFARLRDNVTGLPGVELVPMGLGAATSEALLYADRDGSELASLYPRATFAAGGEPRTETVPITTLDAFCAEHDVRRIDYLKLDVEGHELAVLEGGRAMIEADRVDCIQFEFGGCNIDSRTYMRDFFAALTPRYLLHRIVRGGAYPLERYSERLEVFVTTNYLAVRRASAYASAL